MPTMPLLPLTLLIMRNRLASAALLTVAALPLLSACNGPRVIHEAPVLMTGDRVATADSFIVEARQRQLASQGAQRRRADSIAALASTDCQPAICAAIARGEVTLGMNANQVMAASRSDSTYGVTFTNGRVSAISRQERTGTRVETSPADTTNAARAAARAEALVREGDDYIAAGDRARALERYDRALVMRSDDAMLNYKVATLLDQQLRPQEALMRYQRFLLQMELQRIDAQGTQNAKLAEAIALARERVIVLDRRSR